MKKVVFGHLLLKRPLSLHFCTLLWGFACMFMAQNILRPYFCPARPPNQLTWRKQKLAFKYIDLARAKSEAPVNKFII